MKKIAFISMIFILNSLGTYAANISWTGGTGDWNTAGNWSGSAVPTAADNVTISGTTQTITLSADGVCNNLDVSCGPEGGNKVVLLNVVGNKLTVNGTADFYSAGANDLVYLKVEDGGEFEFNGSTNIGVAGSEYTVIYDSGTTGKFTFKSNVNFGNYAYTFSDAQKVNMVFDAVGTQTITRDAALLYLIADDITIGSTNTPTVNFAGTSSEYICSASGTLTFKSGTTTKIVDGGSLEQWNASTGTFALNGTATLEIADGTWFGLNNKSQYATETISATSTVKYTGASQWVEVHIDEPYGHLIINGSGTSYPDGALNVDGNMTISSGFDAKTYTHTLAKDLTVTGNYITGSTSTFNFDGAITQELTTSATNTFHNITGSGSGTLSINQATIMNDLTINGTKTVTPDAALDINGNVDINSGTTFTAGSFTHTVGGDWADDGTFSESTGTIDLDGASTQALSGGSLNFYNLTHSGSGTTTLNAAVAISNDMDVSAGVFEAGTGSGSVLTSGTGTSTTYDRSPYNSYMTDARVQYLWIAADLTSAGLSTNDNISAIAWDVSAKYSDYAYSNFTIKMAHTSATSITTWQSPSWTTVFSGSPTTATGWNTHAFSTNFQWNGTDGIIIEVCFDNSVYSDLDDYVRYTAQAYSCVVKTYTTTNSFSACDGTTIALTSAWRPNVKFTTVATPTGYGITLQGDFTNSGTYTHQNNKVTFGGTAGGQSIAGSAATTFYDLKIDNSDGVTMTKGATVANNIEFKAGDIVAASASNPLTLGTDCTIDGTFPASAASHVNGYCHVSTTSTSEREVPVGNGTVYRPFYITPSSNGAETYKGSYTKSIHSDASTKDTDVHHISSKEWWEIGRTNSVNCKIKLTYDGSSGVDEDQMSDLAIAHYYNPGGGLKWYRDGGTWTTNTTNDWIMTDTEISSFSPFALMSKGGSQPLPITLVDFSAYALDHKTIRTQWSTASEVNNDFFTVEHSSDGTTFEEIGITHGAGNSNVKLYYELDDTHPFNGITYYRLKQTDYNGQFSYSDIVAVTINDGEVTDMVVYPNPVNVSHGHEIHVGFTGFNTEEDVLVVLMDIMGREIYSKIHVTDHNGNSYTAIDHGGKLKAGLYTVIGSAEGELYNKKLIVK